MHGHCHASRSEMWETAGEVRSTKGSDLEERVNKKSKSVLDPLFCLQPVQ